MKKRLDIHGCQKTSGILIIGITNGQAIEARREVFIVTMFAVDKANMQLDAKINNLRHLMNDQLVELKYGKCYKASFLDSILIKASV